MCLSQAMRIFEETPPSITARKHSRTVTDPIVCMSYDSWMPSSLFRSRTTMCRTLACFERSPRPSCPSPISSICTISAKRWVRCRLLILPHALQNPTRRSVRIIPIDIRPAAQFNSAHLPFSMSIPHDEGLVQ